MLQKSAPLVKRQLEYWQRRVVQYGPDHPRHRPAKTERYRQLVAEFTELLQFLNKLEGTDLRIETKRPARLSPEIQKPRIISSLPAPLPIDEPPAPSVARDEFADLPPELLEQLSEGAKAQVDPIIKIINDRGGTATLDEILIDLYRATKEVNKRTIIQNKVFRLSKREMCWSVPGKKGVYTTQKSEGIANESVAEKNQSEKVESPPAATGGLSNKDSGAAGLPGGSSKVSAVGPTPTASTVIHRQLLSGTAGVSLFPWENSKKKK